MNPPVDPVKPKLKLSKLFWIGIGLLVVGSGPLLLTILFAALGFTDDPNPNPIGFGLMAFLTFWPSVALIVIGLSESLLSFRDARRKFAAQK